MKVGQGNYGRLAVGVASLIAAMLLLGMGCQEPPVIVPAGMLLKHNGVYYHEADTNTPFSGVAEAFYTNTTPSASARQTASAGSGWPSPRNASTEAFGGGRTRLVVQGVGLRPMYQMGKS